MPRRKLSEYRAKVLVAEGLGLSYTGWSISEGKGLAQVKGFKSYVLKVDQTEKSVSKTDWYFWILQKTALELGLKQLQKRGYTLFLLSRSVGFTAHYLDQRRHDEGLLRLQNDDMSYIGGAD